MMATSWPPLVGPPFLTFLFFLFFLFFSLLSFLLTSVVATLDNCDQVDFDAIEENGRENRSVRAIDLAVRSHPLAPPFHTSLTALRQRYGVGVRFEGQHAPNESPVRLGSGLGS